MTQLVLPVAIAQDIDDTFCYMDDKSYQERAHEYLERYEVPRGYKDTAVQVVVTDIARRAFAAGQEGGAGRRHIAHHRRRPPGGRRKVHEGGNGDHGIEVIGSDGVRREEFAQR